MKKRSYSKRVAIFSLFMAIAMSLWFALPATLVYALGGYEEPSGDDDDDGGGGGISRRHPDFIPLLSQIDYYGIFRNDTTVKSQNGRLELKMDKGTRALDKDGKPLAGVILAEEKNPPAPPTDAHIIGLTYNLEPDGATFDPPIDLSLTYDPRKIPEGVNEADLVIARWYKLTDEDTGKWVSVRGAIVDPETNTIKAQLGSFSTYTVIGHIPPPAPMPEPATFTLSDLSISPAAVDIGGSVSIKVLVTNTGDLTDTYTATLKINNALEDDKYITLMGGGSSLPVTFTTTMDVAGTYTVSIDGLSGTFTVKAPVTPTPVTPTPVTVTPTPVTPPVTPVNWWLIGGIFAAVVIIGVFITLVVRRQRA
ncbi:hypothetical protein ACFLWL_00245 [Chloroflexota bacterium]